VRYPVAVGKPNRQWFGRVIVDGKYRSPAWTAPPYLRRPGAAATVIPGGASNNPMGAAALTLSGDRYAIHGTNRPASVGTFSSAGCLRMLNDDVLDLFERVTIGTSVLVQR
jgi:lipoprotein-anchoring transpeptidase ErfK/SrfK